MDVELTTEQTEQAQVYLIVMAAAIQGVGDSTDSEQRRSSWLTYEENQAKLHALLPRLGDPEADEGPYTSET